MACSRLCFSFSFRILSNVFFPSERNLPMNFIMNELYQMYAKIIPRRGVRARFQYSNNSFRRPLTIWILMSNLATLNYLKTNKAEQIPMKFLSQKPLLFLDRVKPFGMNGEWQDKLKAAGVSSLQFFERVKTIGSESAIDEYEKRKLGIFNQLNFFQLLTGMIIPIAGRLSNRHFPFIAWLVACIPALISVFVLVLNH